MSTDAARRVPKATPAGPDGLTGRQRLILTMIYESARDRGYQPTYREIGATLGFASPNALLGHIRALARKGWIARDGAGSRAVRLLRRPDGQKFEGFLDRSIEP